VNSNDSSFNNSQILSTYESLAVPGSNFFIKLELHDENEQVNLEMVADPLLEVMPTPPKTILPTVFLGTIAG
jgi:hypothetical protein